MAPLLQTQDLTIRFGGLVAMDHLATQVERGEVLGLIGPNGSGKTTFLNLITGIYPPSEGTIRFKGKSLAGLAPHEILRRGIARTFQNNRLFANLSVLDNVIIGMHHRQRSQWYHALFNNRLIREELRTAAEEATELMAYFSRELVDERYKRAVELPQAHRRKLEICRALAARPDLLLLDEPAAGMDPEETVRLMEDIRKIIKRQPDIGIVLIEHDMSVISRIADRVVVINYGRKIAEGRYAQVCEIPEVLEAYLGDPVC